MDSGYTKIKSKSILLKPTNKQKRMLLQWMGSYRFVYNKVINFLVDEYEKTGKIRSYFKCRKEWTLKLKEIMPWWSDIPAHTLYGAMMDASKDYSAMVKKRSKGLKSDLPRCRKRKQRSFFILGNSITSKGIYIQRLGPMKSCESLPDKPMDCRIIHYAGRFWLRVPEKQQTLVTDNQGHVCAIDPGIRTFATIFSPDGIGKIQSGGFSRIVTLLRHLDDLQSRTSKVKNRNKKNRMNLAASRMRLKIRNLIDDLHYQTIGWLFRKFDVVIFPDGDFTSAISKASRKIRSKSVRSLMGYAFARFRDRLKHKASLLGKTVKIVCESYTSKTHNVTGEVISNLGGRKTIESEGIKIDRDINGALGVFLKALLVQPSSSGGAC